MFETREQALAAAVNFLVEQEVELSGESFTKPKVCEDADCTTDGGYKAPVNHIFLYGSWKDLYKMHLKIVEEEEGGTTLSFVCYKCTQREGFVGYTLPAKEVYTAYQLLVDPIERLVHEKLAQETTCAITTETMKFSDGCVLNRNAINAVADDKSRPEEQREIAEAVREITGKTVRQNELAPFVSTKVADWLQKKFGDKDIVDEDGEILWLRFSATKTLRRFFRNEKKAEAYNVYHHNDDSDGDFEEKIMIGLGLLKTSIFELVTNEQNSSPSPKAKDRRRKSREERRLMNKTAEHT